MRLRIKTELGFGRKFAPGDPVRGTVEVAEGGDARELSVRLVYREASPDYSGEVFEAGATVLAQGDLKADASYDFTFQLPPDALPNFASAHGALAWVLEAKVDRQGKDTLERESIKVAIPSASRESDPTGTPAQAQSL
jgi:hypothetical protein